MLFVVGTAALARVDDETGVAADVSISADARAEARHVADFGVSVGCGAGVIASLGARVGVGPGARARVIADVGACVSGDAGVGARTGARVEVGAGAWLVLVMVFVLMMVLMLALV